MKNALFVLILLGIGVAVGFILGRPDLGSMPNLLPMSCSYKNVTYKNGEGFKDDCNSCSCENGQVACTLMACAPEGS